MPQDLRNPVTVIPGAMGTSLHDEYPLRPSDLWTLVLNREYEHAQE